MQHGQERNTWRINTAYTTITKILGGSSAMNRTNTTRPLLFSGVIFQFSGGRQSITSFVKGWKGIECSRRITCVSTSLSPIKPIVLPSSTNQKSKYTIDNVRLDTPNQMSNHQSPPINSSNLQKTRQIQ